MDEYGRLSRPSERRGEQDQSSHNNPQSNPQMQIGSQQTCSRNNPQSNPQIQIVSQQTSQRRNFEQNTFRSPRVESCKMRIRTSTSHTTTALQGASRAVMLLYNLQLPSNATSSRDSRGRIKWHVGPGSSSTEEVTYAKEAAEEQKREQKLKER